MDVTTIHSELRQGKLRNFYIFSGTEWAVQQIYIDQISKVSGKEVKRIDGLTSIKKSSKNSFVPVSYIYVARDDKEFMDEEKLQDSMNSFIRDNIFILLLTNPDKRTKFYKRYKDDICEFEALKPDILKKYIQKKIDLSDTYCDRLIEICENDYGRCLLEIDKIKQYQNASKDYQWDGVEYISTKDCFKRLINDGTIYQPPKDAIFDFVDSILDRKPRLAWNLYNQCLEVGEATMVMISVLYTNAKAVLQVQACESSNISASTGLTAWQISSAKKHLNKYRNGELIGIMRLCHKCEQGIKTGKIDEKYAMEYIMVNIF